MPRRFCSSPSGRIAAELLVVGHCSEEALAKVPLPQDEDQAGEDGRQALAGCKNVRAGRRGSHRSPREAGDYRDRHVGNKCKGLHQYLCPEQALPSVLMLCLLVFS